MPPAFSGLLNKRFIVALFLLAVPTLSARAQTLTLTRPTDGGTETSRTVTLRAQAANFAPAQVTFYEGDPNDAFTDLILASTGPKSPGVYEATHTFQTQGQKRVYAYAFVGSVSARSPLVTFTISEPPVIGVDETTVQPNPIDLSGVNETPTLPFTISNPGSGTLNFTLNADVAWVYFTQGSGSVPSGGSVVVPISLDVSLLGRLGPGTYTATVYIVAPGAQTAQVPVQIVLTVTETSPANPVVLPASQRYAVSVSAGRMDFGGGDVQLGLFVQGWRANAAQPGATAQAQLNGPNGPITSPAFTAPFVFEGRQPITFSNDPAVAAPAGDYTLRLAFEDATVTRTVTLPPAGGSLPAPQPAVTAYADGSLTVQWAAVPGAASYTVDLYEVQVGNALGLVRSSGPLRDLKWGFPAGTLRAGATYQILVTAYSLYPNQLPLPATFTASGGWSADFSLGAAAPGLTGTEPQVDVCGRTVTITWTTDAPASTWVHYGLTENYGIWKRIFNETGTVHQIVTENLEPGKTYHFQAYSATPQGLEWRSKDLEVKIHPNALYKRGDVNRSGGVDVSDAILVLQFAVDLAAPADDLQGELADVNGDGDFNVADAILILRIAVGLERDCWPAP